MKKDNTFNYKILFIFLAFVCCFFIFTTNSKATIDVTFGETSYVLPDVPTDLPYENYIIFYYTPHSFDLYNFNGDVYYSSEEKMFHLIDSVGFSCYICSDIYEYSPNPSFLHTADYNLKIFSFPIHNPYKFIESPLYSNVDIYKDSNKSEVVFQRTPLKLEAVEIQTIQEVEEIPAMIINVAKMIIPVGLVILSTVLLVSLIQLVLYRML